MKILLIAFITIFCFNNVIAQSHIADANFGCRLKPGSLNTEKDLCPACAATDKKEQDAKIAEEKRRFAEAQAAAAAKKEASERERLEKIEEEKKNEESGKVYINGNNSNGTTNTSTEQIPDDYKGNPLDYNKSYNGSNTVDDLNNGNQQGQQITEIATGLVELFTLEQDKNLLVAELESRSVVAEKVIIDFENEFKEYLNPNLIKAENGEPEAQIILYNVKFWILSSENKKNDYYGKITSLFLSKNCIECEHKKTLYYDKLFKKYEELLPTKKVQNWIENLASNGNKKAMFLLAKQHEVFASVAKVEDEKRDYNLKSFKLYKSLADSGDVNSMYSIVQLANNNKYLDLVISSDEIQGYKIKAANENCLEAMQSLAKHYYWEKKFEESFFWHEKIANTDSFVPSNECGSFTQYDKEILFERLSNMYRKGQGTPKNKTKADKYLELYIQAKKHAK